MSSISSGTTLTTALVQTADTSGVLQLQTNGGTTAVTIDNSQNFGLGITPSAWNSSSKAFQFGANGTAILENFNGVTNTFGFNTYRSVSSGYVYTTTGNAAALFGTSYTGGFGWSIAPSGTAGTAITFTQAMTLDASGNLGIGTTVISGYYGSSSVAARGVYAYTSSSTNCDTAPKGLVIRNDDTTAGNLSQLVFGSLNTGNTPVATASIWSVNDARSSGFSTGSLAFGTVGGSGVISERARIDSSGNLLVGTTTAGFSNSNSYFFNIGPGYGANGGVNHISGTASGVPYYAFGYNGTGIGSITQNGTTGVLYNLTSDYRLKNNQQALTGAKDFIMALKPKKWQWWDGSGEGVGFVAHEFMEVAKYSGHGEKDAVDADGKPVYQSIQPSSSEVMANLVSFIQELSAQVTTLQSQVTALQSKG